MTNGEKLKFSFLILARGLASALDLIGILAIGFLATSVAINLAGQPSETNREITISQISLPTVSFESLPIFVGVVLFVFTFKAFVSVLLTRTLAKFLAVIEARAVRVIAENAFGQGLGQARQNSKDEIVFAVQVGAQAAFNGLLNSIGILFAEGALFLLVLLAFAFINPSVAIGTILYFGLIGWLIQLFLGRVMNTTGNRITKSVVDTNSAISNLSDVIREATILNRKEFFYDKIYTARLDASGNYATQFVMSGMPRYIVETALIFAIAVLILFQTLSGDLASSAATIGIFLSGGLRLTASLLPLQSALLTIKQSGPAAELALALLIHSDGLDPEPTPDHSQKKLDVGIAVSLENVNYSYPGNSKLAVDDISLEIAGGTQAAFIGVSGSGKSTLADLMLGLLEPNSGSIKLDGLDPKALAHSSPGVIAYVPQRPGLISGTIAENIALGLSPNVIDKNRLEKAISDSHLTSLVDSLDQGIYTDIGKRKDELSGGQLQRIGLARALYSEPKLLVMDEATSALDAESENEINLALREMRGKMTVILIAHRLNTVQDSDVVFLLENGKIAGSGTFHHLRETNKVVKKLSELMSIKFQK